MSVKNEAPIGILPIEMKWKIFEFLNFTERKNLRLVCSNWCSIINAKLKFRAILSDQTKSYLQGCGYQLVTLPPHTLTKSIEMSSYKKSIPLASKYVIGRGNSTQHILSFIRYFSPQIQTLSIENLSLSILNRTLLSGVLCSIKWPHLSSLTIAIGPNGVRYAVDYKKHVESILQILKSLKVKTLTSVSIDFTKGAFVGKPWHDIFQFILIHQRSLRELKLGLFGKPDVLLTSDLIPLFQQFIKLSLKKFGIEYDECHRPYANLLCLRIKGLENLDVRGPHRIPTETDVKYEKIYALPSADVMFRNIIRSNEATLKNLTCQSDCFELSSLIFIGGRLKTLELKTLRLESTCTPYLPALKKLGITTSVKSDSDATNNFFYNLISCMLNRMQNLEELELFILGGDFHFEIQHIRFIWMLAKLRKLTFGKIAIGSDVLESFCYACSSLSFKLENRPPVPALETNSFDCGIIQIDHAIIR